MDGVLESEFQDMLKASFTDEPPSDQQFTAMRRVFMAGALIAFQNAGRGQGGKIALELIAYRDRLKHEVYGPLQ